MRGFLRLICLFGFAFTVPAQAQLTTATIDTGKLQGKDIGMVSAFLGVRFAANAGGVNRWRSPQPVERWTGLRDASRFGAVCEQVMKPGGFGPWTPEYVPQGSSSEDCLFLNLWTSARTRDARLPVMVWIHGGSFRSGSGSVAAFEGSELARQGIIVVTINYRLGVYGFLAHPELTREAGSSGNYGLMDQIAALRWIQRNIAAFGGDPGRVTIAGQSAGAGAVHALIASPAARGLFVRAIAQSGSANGRVYPSLNESEALGERVAQAVGANGLAELRAMPAAALTKATDDMRGFRPITEPIVLPHGSTVASLVPVLTGWTKDEGSARNPDWLISDAAGLAALLTRQFGNRAETISSLYPASDSANAARAMLTDRNIASLLKWAAARPDHAPPVYGYLFTHAVPGPTAARYGAFHNAEITYMFGSLDAAPDRPFTSTDHKIAAMRM